MSSIYDQLAAERLFDPESPTGPLPAVPAAPPQPPAGGALDHLVTPSWNGLRAEDRAFPQPPQDPGWRP